jgi:hypothetical protein
MAVHQEVIYGIYVCNITTKLKVPYQLTFERDLYFNRTNVTLVNLIHFDRTNSNNADLRTITTNCFIDFFNINPDATIYFEIDLHYGKNSIKFLKFLRWYIPYQKYYRMNVELTQHQNIEYAEVYITKI